MSNEGNEVLHDAIMEVIDNQINDNNPPETRQTLDRLIGEGHTEEEVKNLIGCVVAAEMFEVMKQGRAFDEKNFVAALKALPELPSDD